MVDWFQVPAVSTATGKKICERQRAHYTLQSCSLLPCLLLQTKIFMHPDRNRISFEVQYVSRLG